MSRHPGQLRLKAIKVLLVRFHGVCLDFVTLRGRCEEHAPCELGLALLFDERHRHLKFVDRLQMAEDDPLGFHDLDKDTLILIVGAMGAVHDEAPEATRLAFSGERSGTERVR